MAKKMQQRYHVLKLALFNPYGFTRRDAAYDAGCFELASRIGELEAEGVRFYRNRINVRTRHGGTTNVTQYRLAYCPPVLRVHVLGLGTAEK